MTNVMALWRDVLDMGREGAECGACACRVFDYVSQNDEFLAASNEMLDTLGLILKLSNPGDVDGNVGHFLTAVMAVGYALGAGNAYDITLMSELSVPDDLASLDIIETRPGDRPAGE